MTPRKFAALYRVYVKDIFAYWQAALIWTIGDLELAFVMPFVWRAAGGLSVISPDQLTAYYLVSMTVSQFVFAHLMWDIAIEIMEGQFSSQLVRPVSHYWTMLARNYAWRTAKLSLFLPLLALLLPMLGIPQGVQWNLGFEFWISLLLGQFLSFSVAYTLAMVPLWTTEFHSIFQLFYFPELLLSGRVVPLSALPDWAVTATSALPFRYVVTLPTEIAIGMAQGATLWQGIGMQVLWIVTLTVLARRLFAAGTRQYSGVGM